MGYVKRIKAARKKWEERKKMIEDTHKRNEELKNKYKNIKGKE